ncbi:hypothetical protein Ocin01_19596 [Orchesella cincta]|uniref:Uncharacterized protein n=1 Tax=Orchesella cincta TaxID=48709 RepID=A0A1D2M2A1_ORCCI|nr:hypothetical protein Ocin01_19596 [Orchesella cincta]
MSEAFDNPWKMEVKDVRLAHYGIWKHLETEDNSKKAYERKVPQLTLTIHTTKTNCSF